MNSKVCVLGSKGSIPKPHELSVQEFLSSCGMNTGNLLFQYAVSRMFNGQASHIGIDIPYRHDAINGNFDYLILPCANFINPHFDLSGLVAYLEKVRIPIIPIGLGAQAPSIDDGLLKKSDLKPSVQRLVDILEEKSPRIFVRGDFTMETLRQFGFSEDRLIVTGCPSNFISSASLIRSGLQERLALPDNAKTLLITGDEVWPKKVQKRDLERKLVRLLKHHGGIYLVQSVEILVDEMMRVRGSQLNEELQRVMRHIGFDGTEDELNTFMRLFPSVDSWMFAIRGVCLSTGLRLHGNMCSLQSGIPSVWIYHDSRTRELCDTMALPSMNIEEANSALERDFFVQKATTLFSDQMNTYFTRRHQLRERLSSELSQLGVTINWQNDSDVQE
jgi:hypothetical protein